MHLQLTSHCASITKWTLWFLFVHVVHLYVSFQLPQRCKRLLTNGADKLARVEMHALVTGECIAAWISVRTKHTAKDNIIMNTLMIHQVTDLREWRFAICPLTREVVAAVFFVRRVEHGQVSFEAPFGVGDKLAVVMRTRIIAPAMNSAAMFEHAVASQLSRKQAAHHGTLYLTTTSHAKPVIFAFIKSSCIICFKSKFENVSDELLRYNFLFMLYSLRLFLDLSWFVTFNSQTTNCIIIFVKIYLKTYLRTLIQSNLTHLKT